MNNLSLIFRGTKSKKLADALSQLVKSTVEDESGLNGMILKGGLAAATKYNPRFVEIAVGQMLPDLLDELDVYWDSYQSSPDTQFGRHLAKNEQEVSEDLSHLLDEAADRYNYIGMQKVYSSVRGRARDVISKKLNDLGNIVESIANQK